MDDANDRQQRTASKAVLRSAGAEGAAEAERDERDVRWAAVRERDAAADGAFVYAVRTTGVYCRPSCGSRSPLRANVQFFAEPAAAERAGFRACLRCDPRGQDPARERVSAISSACRRIEAELARGARAPSAAALARGANLSVSHFQRVFKATTGVTPRAYALAARGERVRGALAAGRSVTDALLEAGYTSTGRFYADADAHLGMTPSRYRAGGPEAEIRFALGASSLGAVLVAATERGICAIALGDDPEALLRALEDRFPRATLIGGDASFERLVAAAVGLVERPAQGCDLPLDLRGTAFQRRVWDALRRIPAGATATYAEIAERIGRPRAARAVAAACAANPVAVAVPCHRVVRSDGSLSGYRWGIDRKRELLAREGAE